MHVCLSNPLGGHGSNLDNGAGGFDGDTVVILVDLSMILMDGVVTSSVCMPNPLGWTACALSASIFQLCW